MPAPWLPFDRLQAAQDRWARVVVMFLQPPALVDRACAEARQWSLAYEAMRPVMAARMAESDRLWAALRGDFEALAGGEAA